MWVNRVLVANHSGGYTHFTAVMPPLLATGNELIVRAFDPSDAGFQVRSTRAGVSFTRGTNPHWRMATIRVSRVHGHSP